MGLLRWIATLLVGLADRPIATPQAPMAAAAPPASGPSPAELAMLRALFVPTRQGFRSRWWMAVWWLAFVPTVGAVVALLNRIYPPLGPDPPWTSVVLLCVVATLAGLLLGVLLVRATTWRTDERPAIHVVRQCTWWARIIVPRIYASSVVLIVGLDLTVRAFDLPADAERDFDVLAAIGVSVASAGVGVAVVALALPFRRSQTVRSQIDHHIGQLRRGILPSTDAAAELCSILTVGLGSAGMFAIPIVQPSKCERALYLYGTTNEPGDLLPLLEEARARLMWRRPKQPVRRLRRATIRQLDDELRRGLPRPGPVQVATFGIVLELSERPYDELLPQITPVWQHVCRSETPEERRGCLRELEELADRLRV
jgi:hypothetical protein